MKELFGGDGRMLKGKVLGKVATKKPKDYNDITS